MKQRTNKQINSDFKFDKELEKLVTKECRRVLVVSLRGDTVVISGEKSSLDLVNSREDLTIKDLINHMKELGESSSTDDFVYDSTAELHFPPLERKFDGPHWDHATAKSTVTQWFTILGFGRYGNKKYKKESDEPQFWPDSESWTTFEHPSYSSLETLNKILRRMMEFYGLDPETHHCEVLNPDEPARKKKKRKNKTSSKEKSQRFVEEVDDLEEPDNELNVVTGQDDVDTTVTFPSTSGTQSQNQDYDDTLVDQTEYRPPPQIYTNQFGYNYDQQQYNDIYNQYAYDHNENGYNMEYQSLFGHPPTSEPSNNNSQSVSSAIREGLTYTEL